MRGSHHQNSKELVLTADTERHTTFILVLGITRVLGLSYPAAQPLIFGQTGGTSKPDLPGLTAWMVAGTVGRLLPGSSTRAWSTAGSHCRVERAKLMAVARVSPGMGVKIARVSGDRWHHTATC